jgi:molybdate transport system substrate-binding protein
VITALLASAILWLSRSGRAGPPSGGRFTGRHLEVFVGSAAQPPTEDAARRFEELSGARLEMHYGGSGAMLAQIKLARRGDIYFPGSSDYMELAMREQVIARATEVRIAYMIPAINVAKGNPRGVRSIEDLAAPGLHVGIARPDTVCVGLYGVEVLERAGLSDRIRPNILTHAESCAKTAQIVATGQVDAVLGWRVFQYWDPERIETILLDPDVVARIGYLPAAICHAAQDPELARAFLDFLVSTEGQAIFRKWHYLTSEAEARAFARPDTPIGGEWSLPASWR